MGRKRVINVQPGLLPREEAPQDDEPWEPKKLDLLLNFILENGFSQASFERARLETGRTAYACKRQWQLHLYIHEKNSKVMGYTPTAIRHWRGSLRFSAADREILRKHHADGVPPKITATILMRDVGQVK